MNPQRLVGEVLGQVVAVLGQVRLVDVVVVLGQVGIPVVGLAADEAVEAVVALPERPVLLRGPHRPLVDRHVVVLADPVRDPAGVAQDVRHRARSPAGCASCSRGTRSTSRRSRRTRSDGGCDRSGTSSASASTAPSCATACSQSVGRQAVHRRHVDAPAVRRPRRQPVSSYSTTSTLGAPSGARSARKAVPVRRRVADVEVDVTLELPGRGRAPASSDDARDAGARAGERPSPARGDRPVSRGR